MMYQLCYHQLVLQFYMTSVVLIVKPVCVCHTGCSWHQTLSPSKSKNTKALLNGPFTMLPLTAVFAEYGDLQADSAIKARGLIT